MEFSSFKGDEYKNVLKLFAEAAAITGGYIDVEKIIDFIIEKLKSYGIEPTVDENKNITAEVKSTLQMKRVVALHSAIDATKIGKEAKIEITKEGEDYVFKSETSNFGASTLFGVATMLDIASRASSFEHGTILLLFTVNDENCLKGSSLIPKWPELSYNFCINMNSFTGNSLVVGGPCGKSFEIRPKNLEFSTPEGDFATISAVCSGMNGGVVNGFSGNAIQWAAHVLQSLVDIPYQIASFTGGETEYTVASSYDLRVIVPKDLASQAIELIHAAHMDCVMQYIRSDHSEFSTNVVDVPLAPALSHEQSVEVSDMLMLLPTGVLVNSEVYQGFETASTLGKCTISPEGSSVFLQILAMAQGGLTDATMKIKAAIRHSRVLSDLIETGEFKQWGPKRRGALASTLVKTSREVFGEALPFALHTIPTAPSMLFDLGYDESQYAAVGPKIENFRAKEEEIRSSDIEKWNEFVFQAIIKLA